MRLSCQEELQVAYFSSHSFSSCTCRSPRGALQPVINQAPQVPIPHSVPLLLNNSNGCNYSPSAACLHYLLCSALPTAGSPAADASPYGVVLHPAVPYGPKPRHMVDIYVPSQLYKQQQQQLVASSGTDARQQHTEQPAQQQSAAAPVVFFVHGGIWVTGGCARLCLNALVTT